MAIPLSYNLRNLFVRRTSTLTAALGIGLVVMVFILVLALANGFTHALKATGSTENAIILRKGSTAEITSGILLSEAQSLSSRPEIAREAKGEPMVASEMVVLVNLPRKPDGAPANVVVRGTSEMGKTLRPALQIVEGRYFRPGLREIVVGRALSERVQNLRLGDTVKMRKQDWNVVGIFETGRTGFESEIWGDCPILQSAFNREEGYQSMTFRLRDPSPPAFSALKAEIESDPKFQLQLRTEEQYYSEQSGMLRTMITILGVLITSIMAVGAVFGAMNTMYAAVGSRGREIATLRALGFGRGAILASFLAESLLLSLAGGILGCLFSIPIHGLTTGTTNWDTFSEMSFAFRLSPGIWGAAAAFALIMGALGGFFPALRAARLPITTGLRQV